MISQIKHQHGFTLIEVAVVFVIISVLLAASIYPLTSQRESAHIVSSKKQLDEIQEAIYGFAVSQGRIPCPTLPDNGGIALPVNPATPPTAATNCQSYHGFVPSTTLGISGSVNCDGLLIDAWGQPYRYSVTDNDADGNGYDDFITPGEIRLVGAANLNPDLQVCRNLDVNCPVSGAVDIVSTNAVAVIYSLGKPRDTSNLDEDENAGEATIASQCGLADYATANNTFFYAAERREQAGEEFDDILIWISPNILYSKLLQAGQLP